MANYRIARDLLQVSLRISIAMHFENKITGLVDYDGPGGVIDSGDPVGACGFGIEVCEKSVVLQLIGHGFVKPGVAGTMSALVDKGDFMDATVTVKRKSSLIGAFRAFSVMVDGKRMDKVKNGKECTFAVPVGRHEVEIRAFWVKSQKIAIDAGSGELVNFECGVNNKFVLPMVIFSPVLFQLQYSMRGFQKEPTVGLTLMVPGAAFIIYTLMVTFRRNMMYYLERTAIAQKD